MDDDNEAQPQTETRWWQDVSPLSGFVFPPKEAAFESSGIKLLVYVVLR